jgi:hypothetical protein
MIGSWVSTLSKLRCATVGVGITIGTVGRTHNDEINLIERESSKSKFAVIDSGGSDNSNMASSSRSCVVDDRAHDKTIKLSQNKIDKAFEMILPRMINENQNQVLITEKNNQNTSIHVLYSPKEIGLLHSSNVYMSCMARNTALESEISIPYFTNIETCAFSPSQMTIEEAEKQWARLQRDYLCPICLDVLAAPTILGPCGHTFCGDCLDQYIDNRLPVVSDSFFLQHNCPTCRCPIELALKERYLDKLICDASLGLEYKNIGYIFAPYREWKRKRKHFLLKAKRGVLDSSIFKRSCWGDTENEEEDNNFEINVIIIVTLATIIAIVWRSTTIRCNT